MKVLQRRWENRQKNTVTTESDVAMALELMDL
jgi:hypothetical protein